MRYGRVVIGAALRSLLWDLTRDNPAVVRVGHALCCVHFSPSGSWSRLSRMLEQDAGVSYSRRLLELTAGAGCWSWRLEPAAGAGYWSMLLEQASRAGCWNRLLEEAAGARNWSRLLELAAGTLALRSGEMPHSRHGDLFSPDSPYACVACGR